MPANLDATFPATSSGLDTALLTIEHSGRAWNLAADLIARLRIIVEELFSNTIKYGYCEECERPVRLQLSANSVVTLNYEDDAAPFDPTLWARPENSEIAWHDQPEGQTGIALVRGLASTATYQPLPGGNRLVLTFEPARSGG